MKIYYFGELVSDTTNINNTDAQQNKPSMNQTEPMTTVGDILRDTSPYKPRQTRRPQHESQMVQEGLFPAVQFLFGGGSYGGVAR